MTEKGKQLGTIYVSIVFIWVRFIWTVPRGPVPCITADVSPGLIVYVRFQLNSSRSPVGIPRPHPRPRPTSTNKRDSPNRTPIRIALFKQFSLSYLCVASLSFCRSIKYESNKCHNSYGNIVYYSGNK